METRQKLDRSGLLYLAVVYVVWGSTYLAIRIAVRGENGFTPFMLGGMRVLLAGTILLVFSLFNRTRIKLTRRELVIQVVSGLLLWLGGNGLVNLGEQRADSGLAALIVSGSPIWVATLESIIDRKLPSLLLVGALLLGSMGIVVLSMPVLQAGVRGDLVSILALVGASVCWSFGTVFQARNRVALSPSVASGYQHLFGGVGLLSMAAITGEPFPTPDTQAWLAWGYLVVFGSLLAFTSYILALRLLPTRIVMTYSYVNPVIAVLLGWIILGERITLWTVGGAVFILIGVAGVFRANSARGGHGH